MEGNFSLNYALPLPKAYRAQFYFLEESLGTCVLDTQRGHLRKCWALPGSQLRVRSL